MKVKSADIPCRPTVCSHPPQTCHISVLVRRAKEGDLLQIYYVPTIVHTGLLRVGPYSTPIKDFSPSKTQPVRSRIGCLGVDECSYTSVYTAFFVNPIHDSVYMKNTAIRPARPR